MALFRRALNMGCNRLCNICTLNSKIQHELHRKFVSHIPCYDVAIVGAGIVGAATARELLMRSPSLRVACLEKEPRVASHQSGNNSGVIHAGIYYKPGTLKAKLCVEGMELMYDYCRKNRIPTKKVGKLIVATEESEIERLHDLHKRAIANGVPDVKLIKGCQEIQKIEPYVEGLEALHSPHTGIVDYRLVADSLAMDFKLAGGQMRCCFEVKKFRESKDPEYPVQIQGPKSNQKINSRFVMTCCGLYSDKLADMTECFYEPRIIPVRGEYLVLSDDKKHMVNGNIYPVPDPKLPFLGVHFTPRMDGSVWLGPNAVLALQREGYKWTDINLIELFNTLRYPGFLKLALKHFKFGLGEIARSAFLPLQMNQLQRYMPCLSDNDVKRGPSGVRAQALDYEGNLVDDFVFDHGPGKDALSRLVLHCRNAPSPGATSSLAIAKMIVDKIQQKYNQNHCRDTIYV